MSRAGEQVRLRAVDRDLRAFQSPSGFRPRCENDRRPGAPRIRRLSGTRGRRRGSAPNALQLRVLQGVEAGDPVEQHGPDVRPEETGQGTVGRLQDLDQCAGESSLGRLGTIGWNLVGRSTARQAAASMWTGEGGNRPEKSLVTSPDGISEERSWTSGMGRYRSWTPVRMSSRVALAEWQQSSTTVRSPARSAIWASTLLSSKS